MFASFSLHRHFNPFCSWRSSDGVPHAMCKAWQCRSLRAGIRARIPPKEGSVRKETEQAERQRIHEAGNAVAANAHPEALEGTVLALTSTDTPLAWPVVVSCCTPSFSCQPLLPCVALPATNSVQEQLEADYEIVKEYRREYTNFMYRMRADEAMRLRMKKAAINALPPKLKYVRL